MNLKLNKSSIKKINISKNERNLLLLLCMAILIFVFYRYLATPQQKILASLEEKKIEYLDKLSKTDIILAKEDSLKNQWTELNHEFQLISEKYYSKLDQPEIMHQLNKIIDNSNLIIPSINFSSPELIKIGDLDTGNMKISLPFIGSYKDLNDSLLQLKSNPKRLPVSQLSLSKNEGDLLNGQITLEAFTYGDFSGVGDGYFYNNAYQPGYKDNPFKSYDGYIENDEIIDYNMSESDIEAEKRTVIEDLETNDVYFMGTSSNVTGKLNRIDKAKHGKTSTRTEYFISTNFKEERAYIVLDDRNIILKYPPDSIGVWAFSYGYSPITIGFRFQDMDGKKIDLELVKGINWTGWEYISASPPKDVIIYPLKLDRIYLQLGANRDDFGVILFDRIEASYPLNDEEIEEIPGYDFYVVKPGDTLKSISEKFYGTQSQYKNIMKDNGLSETSVITSGKVLVIRNK